MEAIVKLGLFIFFSLSLRGTFQRNMRYSGDNLFILQDRGHIIEKMEKEICHKNEI